MGGVIIVVLIVMWGVLLVPMWLRRHEGDAQLGSVERFSTAMRTLGGRHGAERPVPGRKIVVPGPATVRRDGPLTRLAARLQARHDGPATRAASASTRAVSPVSSLPPVSASRARLLERRRRVLSVLAALSVLAVSGAALGVLPVWPAVVAALLLVAYVAHLRLEAVRAAQLRARRAARVSAASDPRPVTRRGHAPWAPVRAGGPSPVTGPAAVTGAAAGAAVAVGAGVASAAAENGWPEASATSASGDAWEPVPVPLPTYVTAPVAHRPAVRLLDDDLGVELFTRDDEVEELVTRRAANQ